MILDLEQSVWKGRPKIHKLYDMDFHVRLVFGWLGCHWAATIVELRLASKFLYLAALAVTQFWFPPHPDSSPSRTLFLHL